MKIINVVLLITTLVLSFSCKQNTKNPTPEQTANITYITVEDVLQNANGLLKDTVYVSGIIDHVCKHGNKRFKILSSNGNQDIKIELGESFEMPNPDIAGKTAKIVGILVPYNMDADMLKAMINKEREEHKEEGENAHLSKLQEILEQIKAGEILYYTTYSVQAIKYELE